MSGWILALYVRLLCVPYITTLPEGIQVERMEVCENLALRAIEKGLPPRIVLSVAKVESKYKDGLTGAAGECGIMQTSRWWFKDRDCRGDDPVEAGLLALDLLSGCAVINWNDYTCTRKRKERDWALALCKYNGGNRGCSGKARHYSRKVLAMANTKARRIY